MKIHYFQRYYQKENVATANTMLLLSRLYSYSSDKFFRLLKSEFFDDNFEPELTIKLQEKNTESVPDAVIWQKSFKVVIETKLTDDFPKGQLEKHLQSFHNEEMKILLTIAPKPMKCSTKEEFYKYLREYNEHNNFIRHINTTFENLANAIRELIDDRDFEMQNILEDYLDYCYQGGLISGADSWKYMRMQRAGTTIAFNLKNNLYYDGVDRGFRPHDYLGLYNDKRVRAIGKICAKIVASEENGIMKYTAELGEVTEERKKLIIEAINDGYTYGYNLKLEHRYFFVEKFFETDFRKITKRAPMGSRIFDLTQVLEKEQLPSTEEIALELSKKTWN